MGRNSSMTMEQREALMADIKAGTFKYAELAKKYSIGISSVQYWVKKAEGGERKPRTQSDGETAALRALHLRNKRTLELLGRMAQRRPGLLTEIKLIETLTAQHRDLFADCL